MTYFLYLNKVCLGVTTRLHCRSLQLQIWFDSKREQCGLRKNHSVRRVVLYLLLSPEIGFESTPLILLSWYQKNRGGFFMQRKRYPIEFKQQLIQEAQEAGNASQVARRHEIDGGS